VLIRRLLIILQLQLIGAGVIQAQPPVIPILDSIYNLNFTSAGRSIAENSNNGIQNLLEIQLMRWKYAPVALSEHRDLYFKKLSATESLLATESNETDPYFRICNYFFLAEYHFSRQERLKAARALQSSYSLVLKCFDDPVQTPEHNFIRGIYLCYADIYADASFGGEIVFAALKKGNRAEGLRLLRETAFSNSIAGTEAAIYYAHILLRYEENYALAMDIYSRLVSRYPHNTKLQELYTYCLVKQKEYDKAELMIDIMRRSNDDFYDCATDLFTGIVEQELRNNPAKAKELYNRAIFTGEKYQPVLNYYVKIARERIDQLSYLK
jgi:tetratricopeptide (TPR) repeat protein